MNDKLKDILSLISNERTFTHSFVFWFFSAFILVGIDQYSKMAIFKVPQFTTIFWIFKPFVGIWQFHNDKFAFSLPLPIWLMYILYLAIVFSAVRYVCSNFKILSVAEKFGWLLVFGGAISNIGERIIFGSVKDFIYIASGIFNIADAYIIIGIILVIATYSKNSTSAKV